MLLLAASPCSQGNILVLKDHLKKKLVSSTATLDDTLKAGGHLVTIFHLDPCPKLLLFAFG